MGNSLTGTRIGFWGLGNMGAPMARRLVAAGAHVLGRDPNPAAEAAHAASGGSIDPSADLSALDIVVLMLPTSDVVESVLLGDGLADALSSSVVVVDMSSSEPLRTRALAAELQHRGLGFVDAPVSGGVTGAQKGTLTIMAGGAQHVFDTVEPVLAALGRPALVGPVGAGHALKALNNLLSATHLWATSEAILIGEKFGLDPAIMLEAINGSSGRSGSTENKWPNFIMPGTYDSGFGARLMLKDMKIATALGHSLDVPVSLGDAAVDEWASAIDALDADADHTEVVRYLRDRLREMAPPAILPADAGQPTR